MGLFSRKKRNSYAGSVDSSVLAQRALDFITEGVMLIDEAGMVQFANPAAAAMTGYDAPENITGLDYTLVIRLETQEAMPVEATATTLYSALKTNQALATRDYLLVNAQTEKKMAVALSVVPTGGIHEFRIVTFRDITTELAEENEQAEFISTASHEMRTPVASIEGYLALATNPQTATIDARAKQYLDAAHTASQHLGRLFKDLLDVTKLDDKRLKARPVPIDAVETVKQLAGAHQKEMDEKKQKYSFGTAKPVILDKKVIEQKVYMAVDIDFLREIIDNLVGNAIKYTPEGGEIWVNARGDGDKVLINVTDTGIGISAEDAGHVFQKFYRVDNSQTRQIGGTGLGLYLVKQRVEALGGRVWLESSFGEGSTFFVSLPRISESEYKKLKIAYENEKMVKKFSAPVMNSLVGGQSAVSAGAAGVVSAGAANAAPGMAPVLTAAASAAPAAKISPAVSATPVVETPAAMAAAGQTPTAPAAPATSATAPMAAKPVAPATELKPPAAAATQVAKPAEPVTEVKAAPAEPAPNGVNVNIGGGTNEQSNVG